jgi:hypothetical protein
MFNRAIVKMVSPNISECVVASLRDKDSTPDRPVFNRTIGLRGTFTKGEKG